MRIGSIVLFVALAFATPAVAQEDTTAEHIYLKRVYKSANGSLPYRLLLPKNYDSTQKYPMVVFIPDETLNGNDNEKQLKKGAALFMQGNIRRRYPSIVVFPQCPTGSNWSNAVFTKEKKAKRQRIEFHSNNEASRPMALLMALQQELMRTLPVDTSRVYVMGISKGAVGAYELLYRMPHVFAAAIPMAGAGDTATARIIHKAAFWPFHGKNDDVIPEQYTADMVMTLQKYYNTGDMQYTVYAGVGHNCWDMALADPELLRWLYAQRLQR